MRGGLLVCGTTSDAGKSFVVAGLCRLLARRGVKVAPFKAQNMALNAAVTADGAEIGHAQWIQAQAAGAEPRVAMNPVLLKPTGERTSQVVVMGRPVGNFGATEYHRYKAELFPVVLDALASLRREYDVVLAEGAGSPAEINLLEGDIVNLRLARAAGLPAVVVGDIDRGGVFASLFGTLELLPPELRSLVKAVIINKLRGDPALLAGAWDPIEARTGVPCLGVVPVVPGADLDAEDSLALERWSTTGRPATRTSGDGAVIDVAAVRFPRVANFGDLDPLRLEPGVAVRWVHRPEELGRPHLVVLPGSKNTREDLAWFRKRGLAGAVEASGAPVVAICAGLQMAGGLISDPLGVEGPPGMEDGLGWLGVTTEFGPEKVLDRPSATVVMEAGSPAGGERVAGYRIHHGRVVPAAGAALWLQGDDGTPLGWRTVGGRSPVVLGTGVHGLFEADGFRAALLAWVAARAGLPDPPGLGTMSFAAEREARLDRIADALEDHLDLDRLLAIIADGAPIR